MNRALPNFLLPFLVAMSLGYPVSGMADEQGDATRVALATAAETRPVAVARIETVAELKPLARTDRPADPGSDDETSNKTSGTVLATLVLMCAIAIRRHRSGRR